MSRPATRERTALLTTIAALGILPVATGTMGMLLGPAGTPGGEPTNASVDSEYRFANVFWTAAGVLLWWSLRKPEERAASTRLTLSLASAGALPRLLSIRRTGLPHPVFRGALLLELLIVPAVLAWHVRVIERRPH